MFFPTVFVKEVVLVLVVVTDLRVVVVVLAVVVEVVDEFWEVSICLLSK